MALGHAANMDLLRTPSLSRKLAMWLFILSDACTFALLLFAYGYLRTASPDWPTPFKFYPSILNVIIMTFVLITSSLTMLGAVDASKAGDKAKTRRWMGITMVLGAIFAILHIREWAGLIGEGVRCSRIPGALRFSEPVSSALLASTCCTSSDGVTAIGRGGSRFLTRQPHRWPCGIHRALLAFR